MKRAPFWVAATVYGERPIRDAGDRGDRRAIVAGAFSWQGSEPWPSWAKGLQPSPELQALPAGAPLYLNHEWVEREEALPIGEVLDWRDRPEALYALVDLDDTDSSHAAWRAWSALWHSPDSTLSIGAVPLEDELGRIDEVALGDRSRDALPVIRAGIRELSVCTARGLLPQPRMLTDAEAKRMLAGEPLVLERVSISMAARLEMMTR